MEPTRAQKARSAAMKLRQARARYQRKVDRAIARQDHDAYATESAMVRAFDFAVAELETIWQREGKPGE